MVHSNKLGIGTSIDKTKDFIALFEVAVVAMAQGLDSAAKFHAQGLGRLRW